MSLRSPFFSLPRHRSSWTLAAGFLLCTAVVADVPMPPSESIAPDARSSRLERFFERYHCAMPYPIVEYLRAADGYGLDYRVLPAISIRETGCGKSHGPQNNLWGFHQQDFASIAEGVEFLADRLMHHPYYQHKSLRDKLFTYNPKPAYPAEVMRIMSQIE